MSILIGYAIAYGCSRRIKEEVQTVSGVFFVRANSEAEAIGIATMRSRAEYPAMDGYTRHWGIAVSVSLTPEYMKELLNGV